MDIIDILQDNLIDLRAIREKINLCRKQEIQELRQKLAQAKQDIEDSIDLTIRDSDDMLQFLNLLESSIDEAVEFLTTLDTQPRETIMNYIKQDYKSRQNYPEIAWKLSLELGVSLEKAAEIAETVIHDFLERAAVGG